MKHSDTIKRSETQRYNQRSAAIQSSGVQRSDTISEAQRSDTIKRSATQRYNQRSAAQRYNQAECNAAIQSAKRSAAIQSSGVKRSDTISEAQRSDTIKRSATKRYNQRSDKTTTIMKNILTILSFLILFSSCGKYTADTFVFPEPKDTSDHEIVMQKKKTYSVGGVHADNQFDGARMNDFTQVDSNTFSVKILPENFPINNSAWYAFRIWADGSRKINLILDYENGSHRYEPKWSTDGKNWNRLDLSKLTYIGNDSSDVMLELELQDTPLWIAGQEVINSTRIKEWCLQQAKHPEVNFSVIGKSKLGRDMFFMEIGSGDPKGKDIIAIFSRQHPPEVTGYFAMEAFVEKILADTKLSNNFRKKYRILVFPLLNPDGVDLGHWRHNAGGIDLNRDWAYYRQPETRLISNFIVRESKKKKEKVILGLDFHSTQTDLYYTFDERFPTTMNGFHDYWIDAIGACLPDYTPDHQPGGLNSPISKGWFLKQFDAESITYEIGDETPRDFIRKKAEVAAVEMMKLLIFKGK